MFTPRHPFLSHAFLLQLLLVLALMLWILLFLVWVHVDHNEMSCPKRKPNHDPYTRRDNAHLVPYASMIAQHKTMPDGSGAGLGWNIAHLVENANYTMANQRNYRQQQQQKYNGYQQHGNQQHHPQQQ